MNFTVAEVMKCYEFSRQMRGNHNPNLIMQRNDWEIFRDDFRGKLGEVAVRKTILTQFPQLHINTDIDYSVTPRGQWDFTDLVVGGRFISIKSIKGHAQFLLVETNRYNPDGTYRYMNGEDAPVYVNAYILVRVTVEPDLRWTDMNFTSASQLKHPQPGMNRIIEAEVLGGITHEEFWRKKHFAPKGIECNLRNLSLIAQGETSLPQAQAGLKKNQILQQDNYVLAFSELVPLNVLFAHYQR